MAQVVANEYPVDAVLLEIRKIVSEGFATFDMTRFDVAGQIMHATES